MRGRYPLALLRYQGLSNYEQADAAVRSNQPYDRGLGQPETPFNLDDPQAVIELKQALVALAKHGSDPLKNPDPITEEAFKRIIVDGPYASAWEGAAADELVAALSRYAPMSGIDGPYIQLGGSSLGKYGIVGGPQPTAQGLEVIAGAVQTELGGSPRMQRYLTWRDGAFEPPSNVSGPPAEAQVTSITRHGPFWDPLGYTPVYEQGEPSWVDVVTQLDESLITCWQQLLQLEGATEEQRRLAIEECILPTRRSRHEATLKANQGAPLPSCPAGQIYDAAVNACVEDRGVVTLPEVTAEDCVKAYVAEGRSEAQAREICGAGQSSKVAAMAGAVGVGAALGVGIWYLTKGKRR